MTFFWLRMIMEVICELSCQMQMTKAIEHAAHYRPTTSRERAAKRKKGAFRSLSRWASLTDDTYTLIPD